MEGPRVDSVRLRLFLDWGVPERFRNVTLDNIIVNWLDWAVQERPGTLELGMIPFIVMKFYNYRKSLNKPPPSKEPPSNKSPNFFEI